MLTCRILWKNKHVFEIQPWIHISRSIEIQNTAEYVRDVHILKSGTFGIKFVGIFRMTMWMYFFWKYTYFAVFCIVSTTKNIGTFSNSSALTPHPMSVTVGLMTLSHLKKLKFGVNSSVTSILVCPGVHLVSPGLLQLTALSVTDYFNAFSRCRTLPLA